MDTARLEEEKRIVSLLLDCKEARLFFGLLLEETGFLGMAYRQNERDTAFREGERSVGLRVFEMLWHYSRDAPLICMEEYGEHIKTLKAKVK